MRFGQVRVVKAHGFGTHIQRNTRFAVRDALPNHRCTTDLKMMPGGQHFFTGFTGSRAQNSVLVVFIHQKQPDIVQAKPIPDKVDRLCNQLVNVQDRRGDTVDLRDNLKLIAALL